MKSRIFVFLMLPLLIAGGCRRQPERTANERLNTPLTRAEARSLMCALDREVAVNTENIDVARHIRRRLTGRLLTAGVSEQEIKNWIHSPLPGNTSDKSNEDGE